VFRKVDSYDRLALERLAEIPPTVWTFVLDTISSLSDEEKSTLIDLLEKVRTAEHQHLAPDEHFRMSASYDTSDASRLIDRLSKYAPPSEKK